MMAVLNGERMHDTMERLLPGARSAALLWQGAAAFKLFTGKDMPAQEVLEKFFS